MISLLLSMLRARRGQAIAVFLLSAIATAAAVAGPVALRAVDLAIVRNEVAQAVATERSISATAFVNPSDSQALGAFQAAAAPTKLPGFRQIAGGELEMFGPVPQGADPIRSDTSRLVYRDHICEHIVMVTGRCLAGAGEAVIGVDSAARAKVKAGDVIVVQAAIYVLGILRPDGPPATLTVAGTYQPRDLDDLYWSDKYYFPVSSDGHRHEAVFVTPTTYDMVGHTVGVASIDFLASDSAMTLDKLDGLEASLEALTDPRNEDTSQFTLATDMPKLIDRIQAGRDAAHQLVPIAFVPLVALCWFVVFLAVGYGLFGRRHELGLVTLRGASTGRRWWLATAETGAMIILGAPLGYVLGFTCVQLLAKTRLGGTEGTELTLSALPYAAIALLGALVVALLGQRRALAEPVVDLLRGVPRQNMAWRSLVLEGFVVALAVVGIIQLRADDNGLAGFVLLVPGLVVVAVCLLIARAFIPAANLLARFSLRRRWLGTGLAAVQIARRPGSQRLFALIAVAAGLLAFVAAGMGVAAKGRNDRAEILVGAPTVLNIDRANVGRLLTATHKADPEGLWAMAVLPLEQPDPQSPPVLAVDSARLATVAAWRPEFGPAVQTVADKIRPPESSPLVLREDALRLDIEREADDAASPPFTLNLIFESLVDGGVILTNTDIVNGRQTYDAGAPGCAAGCRLTGFTVHGFRGDSILMRINSVKAAQSGTDVIPPADLIKRGRWVSTPNVAVGGVGTTLRVRSQRDPFFNDDIVVTLVDTPLPLRAAATRGTSGAGTIAGLDGRNVEVQLAAQLTMVPHLGTDGALVDLGALSRLAVAASARGDAQVWLGPEAPANAIDRLREAGLIVRNSTGTEQVRAELERNGPALALQFHLAAAAFGVVLALGGLWLVAAVDRKRRADDLRALRRQGLRPRFVRRAALWGYLSLAVAASVAGLAAAGAAWWVSGDRLPIVTETLGALQPPRWPDPLSVLTPWAVAAAALLVGSVIAAWTLRRAVASREGKG